MSQRNIYTIRAGFSFVDVFAKGVFELAQKNHETLPDMQILLPTRRACRTLREAFLRLSNGTPLLLPRMQPLGDVDEDELSMFTAQSLSSAELTLPPAISTNQRLFLLTKLIARRGQSRGMAQDLGLAKALAQLMDQTYTEDLDLKDLPKLVESDSFADHWKISIDFLSIISEHWPNILKELGCIDAADRRNQLLKNLAEHWGKNPPSHFVIAAGSTGSIPATAQLLKTIAQLQKGMVVLPGLDQSMDEESWQAMDDTHPQATLKALLEKMQIDRHSVQTWPACQYIQDSKASIRAFASEIMRPASTTNLWKNLQEKPLIVQNDIAIERYDCANAQEEATVIALALRRSLEENNKIAALVTPDRALARRVAMVCKKWGVEIDDSAGVSLAQTPVGVYLKLCLECVTSQMGPVAILSFLKHAKCQPEQEDWRKRVRAFDKYIARGPVFLSGMGVYSKTIETLKDASQKQYFQNFLSFIEKGFSELELYNQSGTRSFSEWLGAHIRAAEYFCPENILWEGQDGEKASAFLSSLLDEKDAFDSLNIKEYLLVISELMKEVAIRPRYGLHPRVMILGQLEARLLEADTMVLSGLNEGTWPQKITADPWMSRPMRKDFGLPSPEKSIGLSAHDFAQSLCADKVVLTRANRVEGTPTVPSRWLQRMDTVLHACGFSDDVLTQGPLLDIARNMDLHTTPAPTTRRPEPRPPLSARPRELPVTKIEVWMNDPYSIYAQYILKLKPLKKLEQDMDAALRGTLIHDVLKNFFTKYKNALPQNIADCFAILAIEEMDNVGLPIHMRTMWIPRLRKVGEWLALKEEEMRKFFTPLISEEEGRISIPGKEGDFILKCRADRIDISKDGKTVAIIDYKSGGKYSATGMTNGALPQLPLESLIVLEGGFEKCGALPTSLLAYWVMNGSKEGGEVVKLETQENTTPATTRAKEGLVALIDAFDDAHTPYMSIPKPHKAPRYNDYELLARVKEWIALDDSGDDFEEGAAAV